VVNSRDIRASNSVVKRMRSRRAVRSTVARVLIALGILIALGGCGGQSTEARIPPVTTGEGSTIAAGADALAFRAAEAICSQSTLQELAGRYGVRASKNRIKEAVAANFPQSKRAALMGCESGLFGASPEAAARLARMKKEWQSTLAANATDDPAARFENLSKDEFLSRLREAADRYGFQVVEVRWLKPLEVAPLVVVEALDPESISRNVPAILRRLDPQTPVGEDWEGWAFEGFFFEARDKSGTPFLAVYNHWRGSDTGGGQWARSDDLYPFGHSTPVSQGGDGS
jgi:hypothetical protein